MSRGALVILLICAPAPAWAGFAPVILPPKPPAPAAPPPPSEAELFADASAKFDSHDFAGAVADLRAAYAQHPDRAYLLDIAQAYRLMKDCANARQFYTAFLAATPSGAADRAVAERALVGIDTCAAPPPRPPPPAPPPHLVELPPRGGSATLRLTGMVSAGAGVLTAALAAVYGYRAHRASLDIEDTLAHDGGMWTDALEARERDARHFDDTAIGLSIGSAAAMIGGGLLWYLGRAHATTVLVTSEGHGGAIGVAGHF